MILVDPTALAALVRTPEVASALREVLAGAADDEPIPLARLAEQVGSTREILWDEGRRGRLRIEGPRCARVVRRSERDRWLASEAPKAKKAKAKTSAANDTIADERAEARAAVQRAAARGRAMSKATIRDEVNAMCASGDWEDATPDHLATLYGVLFHRCYGVNSQERGVRASRG